MKNFLVAFAVSLAVNLISMYVNYQSYQETHYLAWSYRNHGGEITIEFAPGWHSVHIYAMRPGEHDSHKLVFSPVTFAVSLIAVALVGCAALAKISTGVAWKDFVLLFAGCAALFFCWQALRALQDEFG